MNKISLAEAIPIIEKIVDHNNPEHVGVLATLRWIASLSPQGPILPVVPPDPSDELDRDLHFLAVMLDGAPKCQGTINRARVQLRTQENEITALNSNADTAHLLSYRRGYLEALKWFRSTWVFDSSTGSLSLNRIDEEIARIEAMLKKGEK